jgi:anti-sigma-K factor RskA
MASHAVHDLTPAYALDALDDSERVEYEEHLAGCDRCREELAALREAVSSLAYATAAPAPPPALRDRILEQARSERSNVIPLRPRRFNYVLGAVAAAAASIAIALGIWSASVANERDELQALADPNARVVELPDRNGRLVVAPDGEATLVVDSVAIPDDKDYEIWVFEGNRPRPAGVYEAGEQVVRLTRPVPRGAQVAVTIEAEGGVDAPTTEPLFVVRT